METKILEINLISAQGLRPPSANLRRMQTYAVVSIDSSTKLRTRIDRVGGENPTWNDKFLFKVTPEFLSSETSGVTFEIHAVGCIRDPLIGTVRFLISNLPPSLPTDTLRTPSFIALQIRRPSGRFHGVLNIGAILNGGFDFTALKGASAIGYRDLMGEISGRCQPRDSKNSTSASMGDDSGDLSDGADSTTSSSSTASTALKDWNGVRRLAGTNLLRSSSEGGGLLCGLLMHRSIPQCLSDQNLQFYGEPHKEN